MTVDISSFEALFSSLSHISRLNFEVWAASGLLFSSEGELEKVDISGQRRDFSTQVLGQAAFQQASADEHDEMFGVPLKRNGQVIGSLIAYRSNADPEFQAHGIGSEKTSWADGMETLLTNLAELIEDRWNSQSEMENMAQELAQSFEDLYLYSRIATQIKSLQVSESMLQDLLRQLLKTMRVDLAFAKLQGLDDYQVLVSSPELSAEISGLESFHQSLIDSIPRSAPSLKENYFIVNNSKLNPGYGDLHPEPYRFLAVEVEHKDTSYGWLGLVSFNLNHIFRRSELRLLESIAEQLGVVMDNTNITNELVRLNEELTHEVEERKQAEIALLDSKGRFKDLLENANDIIQSVAPDGRLIFANRAWIETFGYNHEEISSVNFFNLIAPEFLPGFQQVFARVISGEAVSDTQTTIVAKDGKLVLVEGNLAPHYADAKVVAVQGYFRDITAQKRTEEEKKALEAQLIQAQKMEAVGTLAGGLSHDFNNLLQVIQGYTELLLMGKKENDPGYSSLQTIFAAAGRGSELTRQLLTFSREVESKKQPLDLNREIPQLGSLLSRTIPKMIEIEIRLAEDLKIVHADPVQVEQVLMNLAINAKDAMPAGGRLVIEGLNVFLDEEYGKSNPGVRPGEYVLLTFTDTGQGMDEKTLERIFEPFFSTKDPGSGTGLGLSMVLGIIKNHDGHIRCHSKPGEGTVFEVYWPVRESEGECAAEEREEPPQVGIETILLVDDEEAIRVLGEQALSKHGYHVLTTADGESALELYRQRQEQIDLIIMDLLMPGMGGMRSLEKILEVDPHAKVVISSGYIFERHPKRGIEKGARGYLNKPFDIKKMLKVVREVLDEN
jgi:PAS domain S-box-containing protein